MPDALPYRIRAYEHKSGAVRRSAWNGRENRRQFIVPALELYRAGVLSSTSVHPSDEAFRIEGEMRAAQFAAAFGLDADGRPRLDRSYVRALRDSTRSARAGDFGQAVGWVVCNRVLGYRYVVDYGQFCDAVEIPVAAKSKRPDFVAFKSLCATEFALVECKGRWFTNVDASTPALWKQLLRSAQEQGMAGYEHLANRGGVGPRGISEIVSIVALGHAKRGRGIEVQVMRKKSKVEPWDLSSAKRQRLAELVHSAWGTAAAGAILGRALAGDLSSASQINGRVFRLGDGEYWSPDLAFVNDPRPFALAEQMRPLRSAGISGLAYAIKTDALIRRMRGANASEDTLSVSSPETLEETATSILLTDDTALIDIESAQFVRFATLRSVVNPEG